MSVVIKPDPPVKGQPLTINATVALCRSVDHQAAFHGLISFTAEQVTAGTVKIVVKYSIITVLNKSYSLCDLLAQAGTKCPVAPGTYTSSITETIPSSAPSVRYVSSINICFDCPLFTIQGKYTGNVEITDQKGVELACINLSLSL